MSEISDISVSILAILTTLVYYMSQNPTFSFHPSQLLFPFFCFSFCLIVQVLFNLIYASFLQPSDSFNRKKQYYKLLIGLATLINILATSFACSTLIEAKIYNLEIYPKSNLYVFFCSLLGQVYFLISYLLYSFFMDSYDENSGSPLESSRSPLQTARITFDL
jgi:Na+/H+-translocating membrane pyrophosphatase